MPLCLGLFCCRKRTQSKRQGRGGITCFLKKNDLPLRLCHEYRAHGIVLVAVSCVRRGLLFFSRANATRLQHTQPQEESEPIQTRQKKHARPPVALWHQSEGRLVAAATHRVINPPPDHRPWPRRDCPTWLSTSAWQSSGPTGVSTSLRKHQIVG